MLKKIILIVVCVIFVNIVIADDDGVVSVKIEGNRLLAIFTIPEGHHQTLQKSFFYVNVENVEGIKFAEIKYPEREKGALGSIEYHGTVVLSRTFTQSPQYQTSKIKITTGYQLCLDNGSCLFPQTKEFALKIEKIEAPIEASKEQLKEEPSATLKESNTVTPSSMFQLLKFLAMAFIGGLILNVMPCVLPVLSIKAMSLIKQSGQHKSAIFKHSMAYTFGILFSFAVLATVVVILKKSGELVGWGFQFQEPMFVTILLLVILVFALSLFDVFTFSIPGMQKANEASGKEGVTGSFMGGVFAVLLATPCTAPMLGPALGYAFSQSYSVIYVSFLLIGLGLAFPFILLGFVPSAIKILPKPGAWMNTFKEFMGFLLIGTVIFLLRTLNFLLSPADFINVLWFALMLSLASWIYGQFASPINSKRKQWIAIIIALSLVVVSAYYLLDFEPYDNTNTQNSSKTQHTSWLTFSPELIEKLRDENKPIFLDFSAEWCMTCKANEKLVLNTDDIQNAFKKHNVTLVLGDNTRKNPIISQWLQNFNRAGVPLYILYRPGQKEPIIFSEILTKQMIYDALKTL